MNTVYLSGPISLGGTSAPKDIAAFTEEFTEQSFRLRDWGWEVINPCECEPQESWEDYMRLGITAVCKADVVGVLPRWLESRGAVLEVYIARQLGIPVVAVETLDRVPA